MGLKKFTSASRWNQTRALHFYRRIGFGANPKTI